MSLAPGQYSSPLAGMRVIDLSQQLPGPYCTLMLAGLGARVTKVEPPAGDAARTIDPEMFARVSKGKTSVRLDLKDDQDRTKLYSLVAESDVFIEGFRPGVAARLGCDFETLARLNPRLVYCSISGFGQDGPDAARPTHDLSLQAITGALDPDAEVDRVGVPWVDLGTASTAAFLIAAHWRAGRAIHLDLAMLDVASSWASVKPSAVTTREPTYGTFVAADGTVFAMALLEDGMWHRLCIALQIEDWSQRHGLDEYQARRAQQAKVRRRIADELGNRTRAEIIALADKHDLPLDEVHDLVTAAEHEQISWRRSITSNHGLLPFGPGVGGTIRPFHP